MSKEFIELRVNKKSIDEARRQQAQLSYFTQSKVQENTSQTWWNDFGDNFQGGSDTFLNWVCLVFKKDNFNQFVKYLRFPLASSKLIKRKVKPELSRVRFAEDSFFKYTISGEEVEMPAELKSDDFDRTLFNKLLFNYNDILVHDLIDVNKPIRHFISINDVVSIDSHDSVINRIAFIASMPVENGDPIDGFLYIDSSEYIFYDRMFENEPMIFPHDLGVTPADYITAEAFNDQDVVRESMFSELRQTMEQYVFYKTLQYMTEPNGAIPVITKLKTTKKTNQDIKQPDLSSEGSESMSSTIITGVDQLEKKSTGLDVLETGTVIQVPQIRKTDGSLDMSAVTDFINFFHHPVESLEYVNKRVKELEDDILITAIGDLFEPNESAQNELQISKSYISRQDKLRAFSLELTRIRGISDWKFLALQHGKDNVNVDLFFGSDFFLETQTELYDLVEKSPNPIETRSLLVRLTKNRARFNVDRGARDVILYGLLPYASDEDFEKAIDKELIDNITFQYQTRFNYWVNLFEAEFGDMLVFWDMLENQSNSSKFVLVNNLIVSIIEKNEKESKGNINSNTEVL